MKAAISNQQSAISQRKAIGIAGFCGTTKQTMTINQVPTADY
jgi:hypothetical protein